MHNRFLEYSGQSPFELLPIPDATVRYLRLCPLPASPETLLHTLIGETPWRCDSVSLFGKTCRQPRLTCWYADDGLAYTYSGLRMTALPWTALLNDIKATIQSVTDASYNSVLVNYYRDHRDGIGMHSDNEPGLGKAPVIASLSLGESRTFLMKHRHNKALERVRIELASGSLLLMQGGTQQYWKHGIDKLSRPCGPRVNLTFRRILG